MKFLVTLFSFLAVLCVNFDGVAQVVVVPQPPIASTPKPLMSRSNVAARRRFYLARYGHKKGKKYKGSFVTGKGMASDNISEEYAGLFSYFLRQHPNTRYFKIEVDNHAGMNYWTDVWVYDRQFRLLRFGQRDWNSFKTHFIGRNVDDAAIHVLAEDNQRLDKIAHYISRRN